MCGLNIRANSWNTLLSEFNGRFNNEYEVSQAHHIYTSTQTSGCRYRKWGKSADLDKPSVASAGTQLVEPGQHRDPSKTPKKWHLPGLAWGLNAHRWSSPL